MRVMKCSSSIIIIVVVSTRNDIRLTGYCDLSAGVMAERLLPFTSRLVGGRRTKSDVAGFSVVVCVVLLRRSKARLGEAEYCNDWSI